MALPNEAERQNERRKGIPSARKWASAPGAYSGEELGDLAIGSVCELLDVLRTFVVEAAETDPHMQGYLNAYEEAVAEETAQLRALTPRQRIQFGAAFLDVAGEFAAFDQLAQAPETQDDDKKKKKKKAGSTLKKELKDILPIPIPGTIEKIIESILDLL
jgi:hypothetical protein